MAHGEIDISFDKQWTWKRIQEHRRQEVRCQRLERALAETCAKLQAKIDAEREVERELLRTRNASECNFERRWGYEAWRKLTKRAARPASKGKA